MSALLGACGSSSSSDDDDGDNGLRLRDLNGTWSTECLTDGVRFLRVTLNINDGVVAVQKVTYTDQTCMTIMMDEFENFEIELRNEVTVDGSVDSITGATEIDITNTTPMSPDIGEVEYDLVAIKDSKLYLGDTSGANDGSTEALRPTQLDGDIPFTKCDTC